MIAKQRIYRTADGEICDESDPRVAFVVVNVGHEVPKEYVAKVKAFYGDESDTPVEDAAEDEPKAAEKSADKAVKHTQNKGR